MLIDLHTDIETASELDLTEVGLDVYSAHPSTRILMVAWELGNEPIKQWSIAEGRPPRELIAHLRNPNIRKWAHHAQFEHILYSRVWDLDLPIEEWRCTMVWAYMLSLPGKLEDLGKVLLLPEHLQKLAKEGKRLIRKFSMPQKITRNQKHRWRDWNTDPEDWQKFLEYNVQDVVAESFIAKKRLARYEMPQRQWDEWHLDQEINIRGIPMDRLLVANAAAKVRENTELLLQRMHEITKLDNPNSDKQFGPWVRARGYPYHNLKKATVQKVLDDPEMSHLHEVLTIRSQLKKTSVKKYITLDQYIGEGDRLRFTLQFAGASRTQRWAGRGPHFQNPPRPDPVFGPYSADIIESVRQNDWEWIENVYGDAMKPLSCVIRGAIRAPEGYELVIADYAQIEARFVAWYARCESMLDVFSSGKDIYQSFGIHLYHKAYEDITKFERQDCKPPVLGCGFRLGAGGEYEDPKTGDMKKTGLFGYADSLGIKLTIEQCVEAVEVYRAAYPEVVQCWYDLEQAAKQVITKGGSAVVGHLRFDRLGPFLRMILPNGDALHYLRPAIEKRKMPWGAEKWCITFEGKEEEEGGRKIWGRQTTHGGKLMENAAQAGANRLMRAGSTNARDDGFPISFHLHDELDALVKRLRGLSAEKLCAALCRGSEKFYPGLPLVAEGRIVQVFGK